MVGESNQRCLARLGERTHSGGNGSAHFAIRIRVDREDYLTCCEALPDFIGTMAQDDDDRLDGPRSETHRIHLPAGFLTGENASLKGWQIEVGYRDENNQWIGNVQRTTLEHGASSKAMTFELDIEYPRAIRRRGDHPIELRIYAPNNAPAKAYQLSLQSFEYDPAIVAK